jgi:hypothetical protein
MLEEHANENPEHVDDSTDYEVRMSLLEHFSSQCRVHATHLLTLALIALGVAEVVVRLGMPKTVLAAAVFLLSIFWFRTLLRTAYYGWLAHGIVLAPWQLGKDAVERRYQKKVNGVELLDCSLKTAILHTAAAEYVDRGHRWMSPYGSFFRRDGWGVPVYLGLVLGVVTYLILAYLNAPLP